MVLFSVKDSRSEFGYPTQIFLRVNHVSQAHTLYSIYGIDEEIVVPEEIIDACHVTTGYDLVGGSSG